MSRIDSQHYVNWFRHSSPYINAYRGCVFVIMLPGEALEQENFWNIAHDITLLNSLGVKLVLVHGARPQIEAALAAAGLRLETHEALKDKLHNEVRVTTPASLEVIKGVVGRLRIEIEAAFSMGLTNSPMHGADINLVGGNFIVAQPFGVSNGIDYSHTGEVRKVDFEAIRRQLDTGNIVLLSTLGYSTTGEVFNLTVEEVAAAAAIALSADKLLIYGSEPGILDGEGQRISKLSADEARALIRHKIATTGVDEQLRNLELGMAACQATVKRAQVISYLDDGALLIELFTRDGTGTLITQEQYEQIRTATIDDVGGILELIEPLENAGILVHRSRELLETEITKFTVIEREGAIIACGALYQLDDNNGELACLVTHPEYRKANRAQQMLEWLENKARQLGLKRLFVLTTKSPHWFLERGFREWPVGELPEKKKGLYNYQRNSKVFAKEV